MRVHRLLPVLAAVLLLSGCWPFGKKKPQVSTPKPRPAPVKMEPPPTVEGKPVPTAPPTATIDQTLPPPPPTTQEPQVKPPKRAPRVRPPTTSRGAAKKPAASAQPTEPAPPQQPAPAGKLGEILTDEQKSEYRRTFQQSDSAARQLVAGIAKHQLSSDQQDVLARIQSFLQQASEAAEADWSLAAQLARRAELLARDLSQAIQ